MRSLPKLSQLWRDGFQALWRHRLVVLRRFFASMGLYTLFVYLTGFHSTVLHSLALATWAVLFYQAVQPVPKVSLVERVVSLWSNGMIVMGWSGLGLLFGLFPGLYWWISYALLGPVVVYEGRGLVRASRLVRGRHLYVALHQVGLFVVFIGWAVVCDMFTRWDLSRLLFEGLLSLGLVIPWAGNALLYRAVSKGRGAFDPEIV